MKSHLEMDEVEEILIKMQKRTYRLEKRVETLDGKLGRTIDALDKATKTVSLLVKFLGGKEEEDG